MIWKSWVSDIFYLIGCQWQ